MCTPSTVFVTAKTIPGVGTLVERSTTHCALVAVDKQHTTIMISMLMVLNQKGDIMISRQYRYDWEGVSP
jgi:hypothetical protein